METATLTPASIEVTRLGFGCSGLLRAPSRSARQRVLAAAFDGGIRHFDVARSYGLGMAEAELGRFLRGRRDQVTVATKFGIGDGRTRRVARWQSPARAVLGRAPGLRRRVRATAAARPSARHYDGASALQSLERSLRELGTDYVDFFFVHEPTEARQVPLDDLCASLETAREAGQIRAWGVSAEPRIALEVASALGHESLLQVRDDVFTRALRTAPKRDTPAVTFGALSSALPTIVTHLGADVRRAQRWNEAIGVDCREAAVVASLLLRGALADNTSGAVLFGSSNPAHIATGAEAASPNAEFDGRAAAFTRLVEEELTPSPSTTS